LQIVRLARDYKKDLYQGFWVNTGIPDYVMDNDFYITRIHFMYLYPLKFKPIYKQRIWGGQKLREVFGKDLPADKKIGESWELADLPNDKSVIANGELAGRNISEVLKEYPREIMGDENFSSSFPLLVKFLDAEDILSVQVHPDGEACRRMGKGDSKAEYWYIISAEPGAVIYKGFKKGVTKDKFFKAIKQDDVTEFLNKLEVRAGECYFLPAGTVHAIGAGVLIAEIQPPSDTTYRVFDWNRFDENGKSRELHIDEALESIHFDNFGGNLPVTTVGRLLDSEYFKIDKGHLVKGCEVLISQGQMKTLIILAGNGTIADMNEVSIDFKKGDTLLIPAEYEGMMRFEEDTEYLTATL
jgi:mannose-6-phosphate isomerase